MSTANNSDKKTAPAVRELTREAVGQGSNNGKALIGKNVDLVRGVKVRLQVRLGECEMSIGELFDLKEHAIVELDRDVTAPVDVLLDDRVIARGTLVAAGDNFAVRITDISE